MRSMKLAILAGAGLSALLAMWFMQSALRSSAAAPAPAAIAPVNETPAVEVPKTENILVAARTIEIGRMIEPEDVRWQTWPLESVHEHHFTESDDADAIEEIEGMASRLPIVEGEPISREKVIDLEGSGVLASLLRSGMRAVAVPLSDVTGAGGFILPGDYIDLLLTRQIDIEEVNPETGEIEKTSELNQTETIMETIRVVAIDQQLNDEGGASVTGNTATLEVMPEQAELITLARQIAKQERGFLTLSLRSFGEMVEEFGEGLDDVVPKTIIDLRALAKEKAERAKKLREQFREFSVRKEREEEEERVRRELELAREAERELLRTRLAAELEAETAQLARIEAERSAAEAAAREAAAQAAQAQAAQAAAAQVTIDTSQGAAPQPAPPAETNSIIVIRNGTPIVVPTLGQ